MADKNCTGRRGWLRWLLRTSFLLFLQIPVATLSFVLVSPVLPRSRVASPQTFRQDNPLVYIGGSKRNKRNKKISINSQTPFAAVSPLLANKNDSNDSGEGKDEKNDNLLNDQREGMADAFKALDSLSADDFDDLKPISSKRPDSCGSNKKNGEENIGENAKLYMEMQAELSDMGEEGLYIDILGELSGDNTNEEDDVGLMKALDEAFLTMEVDSVTSSSPSPGTASEPTNDNDNFLPACEDGIGSTIGSVTEDAKELTIPDITNDVLSQDIKTTLSMEEFMTKAVHEAVSEIASSSDSENEKSEYQTVTTSGSTKDIALTAEQLLEDENLRKEIEAIFDQAGEKLRYEVEVMRKEQEKITKAARNEGLDYLETEKERLAAAEASVSRLMKKVAAETDEVQKAMVELERAQRETGVNNKSLEDTALDLKKGGLVKQASLIGGLLFGSRAFTETLLVLGGSNGDDHILAAIVQATIALVCAAYFFFVKLK